MKTVIWYVLFVVTVVGLTILMNKWVDTWQCIVEAPPKITHNQIITQVSRGIFADTFGPTEYHLYYTGIWSTTGKVCIKDVLVTEREYNYKVYGE